MHQFGRKHATKVIFSSFKVTLNSEHGGISFTMPNKIFGAEIFFVHPNYILTEC